MITIEPIHLVYALAYVVVTLIATALGLLFTLRAPVRGLRNQARSAMYVFAYDDALQWLGVPGKKRRALYGELRANIAAASDDSPLDEVLQRMGPPRDLARAVAAGPPRPLWVTGMIAGIVAAVVYGWIAIVGVDLMASAAESIATPGESLRVNSALLPGLTFEASTKLGEDGLVELDSMGLESGPGVVVLPLLVTVLFARPWRVLALRNAATVRP